MTLNISLVQIGDLSRVKGELQSQLVQLEYIQLTGNPLEKQLVGIENCYKGRLASEPGVRENTRWEGLLDSTLPSAICSARTARSAVNFCWPTNGLILFLNQPKHLVVIEQLFCLTFLLFNSQKVRNSSYACHYGQF